MDKKMKFIVFTGMAIFILMLALLFIKISILESKIANASTDTAADIEYSSAQADTPDKEGSESEQLSDMLTAEITINDHWGSYGEFSSNTSVKLSNNSSYTAKDWTITIPVENGTKIENIWNGSQTNSNNIITITPASYNSEIPPNTTIELGFIINSVSNIVFDSYSASAKINSQTVNFNYVKEKTSSSPSKAPVTIANNGVEAHGQLKVNGTNLVDKNGNTVILKGMSSHGLAWYPQFANKYTIEKTKQYGANVYRAAMYTEEYGGYTTGSQFQNSAKTLAFNAVDTAISLDMYAVLDWHILQDGDPQKHKEEAKAFFDEASKKYMNNPAVIYEICNEPNNTSWETSIKPYAEEIIPIIRKNSPNAIILVGTNTWSQDVDEASYNKLEFDNIMYTFHFYAGEHSLDTFKPKIETALANGCAVFVSEWGTTKADGNNGVYLDESIKWLEYLTEKGISRINWSLSDKAEASAALNANTDFESFTYEDLSESGKFVFDSFTKY